MKRRTRTAWVLGAGVCAGMLGFVAPPPPPGQGAGQDRAAGAENGPRRGEGEGRVLRRGPGHGENRRAEEMAPERFRAMLEQRLEFVERQQQQINSALAILDGGGSVEEAARIAREGDGAARARPIAREKLSEGDREQILVLMAEHMPSLHAKLTALRVDKPKVADEMLNRMGGVLLDVVRTKLADDEMGTARLAELRASWDVLDVVNRIREANAEDGEDAAVKLRPDLTRAIKAQFVAKSNLANLELQRLRGRVVALETKAIENVSQRDEHVEQMTEKLSQRAVRGEGGPGRGEGRPRRAEPSSTPNGG